MRAHNLVNFNLLTINTGCTSRDEADIKSCELGVLFDQLQRVVGKGILSSFQPTLGSLLNPMNILRASVQDVVGTCIESI